MIAEQRIARVMAETGMGYLQARRHLQQRDTLAARRFRPAALAYARAPVLRFIR